VKAGLVLAALVTAVVACAPAATYRQPTARTSLGALVPDVEDLKPAAVTLHLDVDFTPVEREAMTAAASIWFRQTSGLAAITLTWDLDFDDMSGLRYHEMLGHNTVVRLTSDLETTAAVDKESGCNSCVLGFMTAGGIHSGKPIHGAFIVDRLITPNRMLQVFLHEFGHVLGLSHRPERHAIMFASIVDGKTPCLKRPDLVGFCDVNDCYPTSPMLACE